MRPSLHWPHIPRSLRHLQHHRGRYSLRPRLPTVPMHRPPPIPAKLTQLLYHRFRAFNGDPAKGLIILPCELIFRNGHHLVTCIRKYIDLWATELGSDFDDFSHWLQQSCYVCTTLVDRIVPGFPRKDTDAIQHEWLGMTRWWCKPSLTTSGS